MKKLAIAMMLGIAAMSASAQVNYKMQVACNPQDVKTYETACVVASLWKK